MSTTAEGSAVDTSTRPRATFSAMVDGTQEDWNRIATATLEFSRGLADRVVAHLRLLGGDFGGFQVDRLTHSLQTATRAYRDDRDDEEARLWIGPRVSAAGVMWSAGGAW